MQAAYFLERLGALRLDAEASRAKLYVDLQRTVNAGERARVCDLRGLIRVKEAEKVTLDRMAEAVLDRLVALRSHFGCASGKASVERSPLLKAFEGRPCRH